MSFDRTDWLAFIGQPVGAADPQKKRKLALHTDLSLFDAVLLRDGARVELPDGLVLEEVAAADLTVPLVRPAVTRLQADDVREAPAVIPVRGSAHA